MNGKNTDSLVYDIRNKMVYIYNEGDINYQDMNLKADFMRVNMDTREIYAYGKPDTLEGQPTVTRPEFTEGSASPYKMDTITYNFKSGKAKIKGVATQEGDRMAHRRQREEDAQQQQSTTRAANTPPATRRITPLLSGHDQGEGDSGQEGGHRPRLPGHGGRTDLFPRYSGGLLPDQFGPQVGNS